jgi:plasmid stabilization system protein ParE
MEYHNSAGVARLVEGQYRGSHQLGLHQGKYEALVQRKPVTVYRDGDKDDTAEEQGKEDTGLFGINIHRANPSAISSIIDKWSAGCQVLNDPKQYATLIAACKTSGKKNFTYTLLREF